MCRLTCLAWVGVLAIPLAVLGFGQGIVAPPLITTVLARVPADDAGAASGVLLTATQIANALGVAIVGGTFTILVTDATRRARIHRALCD